MATRKKYTSHHEIYFLSVKDFSASHHSGLNYQAVDAANSFHVNVPVYSHDTSLIFECECFYPDTHTGLPFRITVYACDERQKLTLDDCAVLDENNHPKMITRRGALMPVHKLPDGIGSMEKVRGKDEWSANCFVSSDAVSKMINILSLRKQCYITLDEKRIQRRRVVRAIDLQTEKPE